jgi:NAD-dependent SIR2 family protein deacetylase
MSAAEGREEISSSSSENPNDLQVLYPDEITSSIYWTERAQYHHKDLMLLSHDSSQLTEAIHEAAIAIAEADAILFVTGAGAGVDMGLPDFRTSAQFWKDLNHPGIERYEDSSDTKLFEVEPEFMWGLNYSQLHRYRTAEVHEGYLAMAELMNMKEDGNYFCYTSNIDGVLRRIPGIDPSRVREIHGNIHRLQCVNYYCLDPTRGHRHGDVWDERVEMEYDPVTFLATSPLPTCRHCGGLARPNVWYCKDSNYVLSQESKATAESYERWIGQLEQTKARVVVVECGAGLAIPSARIESELICERLNGSLVRINPTDYMVPVGELATAYGHSVGIPLGAKQGLVRILQEVRKVTG